MSQHVFHLLHLTTLTFGPLVAGGTAKFVFRVFNGPEVHVSMCVLFFFFNCAHVWVSGYWGYDQLHIQSDQ